MRLSKYAQLLSILTLGLPVSGCYDNFFNTRGEHLIEFNRCDISYNGRSLMLGESIHSWVEVLGPYSRTTTSENTFYTYDNIGVFLTSKPATETISSIALFYDPQSTFKNDVQIVLDRFKARLRHKKFPDNNLLDESFYEESIVAMEKTLLTFPKQSFQQTFTLDGLTIEPQTTMETINNSRLPKRANFPLFKSTNDREVKYDLACPNGLQQLAFLTTQGSPHQVVVVSMGKNDDELQPIE